MNNKFTSFLFSTRLMAVLFITFAIAMGVGTFVESKYNTDTARIWIYNAWWFEAIMGIFVINFIGNIKRYQLLKKEKWASLLLHLSFILILIGAFITRYISYEGMMNIREGAAENVFYSDKMYLTIFADGEYQGEMRRKTFEKSLLLSPVTNNNFSIDGRFGDTPFKVSYQNFLLGAKQIIKPDANGVLCLKLVEAGESGREEHFLKEGEIQNIHNLLFSLNKFTQGAINITVKNNVASIQMPFDGDFMRMADQLKGKVIKDKTQALMFRSLYSVGEKRFVFPDMPIKGIIDYESTNDYKAKSPQNALLLKLTSGNEEKTIQLLGSKGKKGEPKTVKIGKIEYSFFYGSKEYTLPFQIKLNDFIAQKYPGTEKSYSSYESKVTVLDSAKTFDARIFMNNILDYKGYRFFQSSFDPDEKGTILSVNHDFWGSGISYLGYFLLYFAMMAILFTKHSRFADLKRKLEIVGAKKSKLVPIITLFLGLNAFAQEHKHEAHASQNGHEAHITVVPTAKQIDSILSKRKISAAHAAQFGRLIIQDAGGRMKPINTFSSELLRKVSHQNSYKDMNPDQVFLSMTKEGNLWIHVPIIFLKSGNDSIRKIIGIGTKEKYAPFVAFFDRLGNYKLSKYLDAAYKAGNPNQFEKDFIEADKKVNLMNDALSGSILKIFPVPNDANSKWISHLELSHSHFTGMAAFYTQNILRLYFESLDKASTTGKYADADGLLGSIEGFQKKYGSKVRPSEEKINLEIQYNKYDVFQKLPYWYLTAAILMLLFTIIGIFQKKKWIRILINTTHIAIALFFAMHTLGLIARWYISGHAPWSNAYESIIYVAWATMFFGLAFDFGLKLAVTSLPRTFSTLYGLTNIKIESKSKLTVASCAFVTSMILAAAYANWIDPEIANLQPVLNSYWLMIHVAVIVASYGPFALGMILGVVSLILILCTNKENKTKMDLHISEITYINEMALTIGLIMLTIGNFLGGQWANESWGRYWGWDPKETWALISIMVYAFVIHARFVPALRGKWVFNLISVYAFLSILFTYYGVNFHLVGLHSYASGEAKSLDWIYYSLFVITILGLLSYPSYKRHFKK